MVTRYFAIGIASHEVPDRPDLETTEGVGHLLGELDRLVQVGRLDQVEAAERLLGLEERSVGDGAVGLDRPAGDRRLEGVAADHHSGRAVALVERRVLLAGLLGVRAARHPTGFVFVDEDRELRHGCSRFVRRPALRAPQPNRRTDLVRSTTYGRSRSKLVAGDRYRGTR